MCYVSLRMAGKKPASPSDGDGRGPSKATGGGRRSAVESVMQFAELIEEDGARLLQPASYVTTGSHKTFELMVRTHERSPTSSFLLCSLCSDALSLPQRAYLDFSDRGNGKQQPATTVRFSPRTPS